MSVPLPLPFNRSNLAAKRDACAVQSCDLKLKKVNGNSWRSVKNLFEPFEKRIREEPKNVRKSPRGLDVSPFVIGAKRQLHWRQLTTVRLMLIYDSHINLLFNECLRNLSVSSCQT